MKKLIFILVSLSLLSCFYACGGKAMAESDEDAVDYQTGVFMVQDTFNAPLRELCEVKYYVNGDTLFTSEKYHFMTLIYSYNDCDSMAYQHIIVFNRFQEPNANGWYHLTFADKNVPRSSDTHLTGFVLRNYYGDKYVVGDGHGHPDAYLYNVTKNISSRPAKDYLDAELQKLYPYIK